MAERCQAFSVSESHGADEANEEHVSEMSESCSSTVEPSPLQQTLVNLKRKMMIVKALKVASPENGDKWKAIRAEDLEPVELSATLKSILQDYTSCSVDNKSSSSPNHVQTSVQIRGNKGHDRISNTLRRSARQINPLCEYSPDIIPEFKTATLSVESRSPTPELTTKDMKSTRRPFRDVKVMREENLKQAIWKASAVRPTSAFERKLQRLTSMGSDSLPQPVDIDAAKEVSRWPTTSASHHSQFGPKSANQQAALLRKRNPNASKVAYDVIMPKDRSNLYNKVQDLLLTGLQNLPEDASLSSPGYVAVFFEALGLLSDNLTTYKPLLQAIVAELKSVFDVQNQCEHNTKLCS